MYEQIISNKRRTDFLIGLFFILIIGLGWWAAWYYQNDFILIFAFGIALIQSLGAYYYGDRVALLSVGAQPAPRSKFLRLHRIVENLSLTAGLPKPRVYIIPSRALNAFATGRDPKHSSIAVTSGLLSALNKTQLEGVLAHEISHIRNFDIRLMTLVVVLVGTIALVSDWLLRLMWWSGGRRRGGRSGIGLWLWLLGFLLILLSYFFAWLIQLAISRKREYLADASAALLTRYPEGLAEALEIIARSSARLRSASSATAHLFINDPRQKHNLNLHASGVWRALFSTHPPIQERIKRLRQMD